MSYLYDSLLITVIAIPYNEHELHVILDILEVNIRDQKLSDFRFEFGHFNSKLIHFFCI